jgi:chemotaxis protein MotB
MARRKKMAENEKAADVGAIMTICLFLILLTFFILLNSIGVRDDRKVRVAIGSLTGAFGSFPGGLSAFNTGDSIMPDSSPMIEQKVDLSQLIIALDQDVLSQITFGKEKDKEVISIAENALFKADHHTLKSDSLPLLNRLSRLIREGQYPVDIIGYTDNELDKEKGYESNRELSGLMAVEVIKYLIDKGQIAPERLTALGRGDQSPVASNDTPESRAQNRRIEIILNYKAPVYVQRAFTDNSPSIFTYKRFNFKVSE